jgi:hypothetical protein
MTLTRNYKEKWNILSDIEIKGFKYQKDTLNKSERYLKTLILFLGVNPTEICTKLVTAKTQNTHVSQQENR